MIEIIMILAFLSSFIIMINYESRFITRSLVFSIGIIQMYEGCKTNNKGLIILGLALAIVVLLMNHYSRRIIAIERPKFNKRQLPLIIALAVVVLISTKEFYGNMMNSEISIIIIKVVIFSPIAIFLSYLFLKAFIYDFFVFWFLLLSKNTITEKKATIISSQVHYNDHNHISKKKIVFEVLSDKRRVEFNNKYIKILGKSKNTIELKRDITYKKSNFCDCIIITKLK